MAWDLPLDATADSFKDHSPIETVLPDYDKL